MLQIETFDTELCFLDAGRALPWLGEAIVGLMKGRLKAIVCRHDPAERVERWRYCYGCEHVPTCAYGSGFEADRNRVRPVVISTEYPAPREVRAGDVVGLRFLVVRNGTTVSRDELFVALDSAGKKPGLGPERVRFRLAETGGRAEHLTLRRGDLPASVEPSAGVVPRVTIELTAPLFVRRRDENDEKTTVERPAFDEFVRRSTRVISGLFRAFDAPLDVDYGALHRAAADVRIVEDGFAHFSQRTFSTRNRQPRRLHGTTGFATFADVPAPLLPWLAWGGLLHVGDERASGGAGSFRLRLP